MKISFLSFYKSNILSFTSWPTKSNKIVSLWPFAGKFVDPWSRLHNKLVGTNQVSDVRVCAYAHIHTYLLLMDFTLYIYLLKCVNMVSIGFSRKPPRDFYFTDTA